MRLPNAKQAIVEMTKLEGYALNDEHPSGRHKARVFAAALGLTAADALLLKEKLLEIVQTHEAVEQNPIPQGRRFRVDFEMKTDVGEATIRSAWIIRADEIYPRLTSCYVLTE